jgi:hypothetical protein
MGTRRRGFFAVNEAGFYASAMLMWGVVGLAVVLIGERWPKWGFVTALLATVVLHLGRWTYHVDDAGISFVYARSLATGHGLVPQPGAPVVEGFSNPAWVGILTLFAGSGADLLLGAEVLELALALLAVVLTRELALTADADAESAGRACAYLSVSGAFVAWTSAGLEGALYAVLLLLVALGSMAAPWMAGVAGVVAAWTRPEGALAAAGAALAGGAAARDPLRGLAGVAGALIGGVGLVALRLTWLGTWIPNTVAAKWAGPAGWPRGWLDGTVGLVLTGWVFVALLSMEPAKNRHLRGAVVAMAVAWTLTVLSGGDWMYHARFLAPWVPAVLALSARALFDEVPSRIGPWMRAGLAVAGVSVLSHTMVYPTVPLQHGLARGPLYHQIGTEACGRTSVATPDVGGVLWATPNVRVIDLAGLVDIHGRKGGPGGWVARIRSERPAVVDLHDGWAARTGLSDTVLSGLGYRTLCRRGNLASSPTLWLDVTCTGAFSAETQDAVDRWCVAGTPAWQTPRLGILP